jgi:hypothetical protein
LHGDVRRIHIPLVVRGADNHGVGAMRCGNCHNGSGNNETSGTPGAGGPGLWQLAPVSMLWQGLSSGELCRMLKDKGRNGGRDGSNPLARCQVPRMSTSEKISPPVSCFRP